MSGRAGNDIASAYRRILDAVVKENEITELITSPILVYHKTVIPTYQMEFWTF